MIALTQIDDSKTVYLNPNHVATVTEVGTERKWTNVELVNGVTYSVIESAHSVVGMIRPWIQPVVMMQQPSGGLGGNIQLR